MAGLTRVEFAVLSIFGYAILRVYSTQFCVWRRDSKPVGIREFRFMFEGEVE